MVKSCGSDRFFPVSAAFRVQQVFRQVAREIGLKKLFCLWQGHMHFVDGATFDLDIRGAALEYGCAT